MGFLSNIFARAGEISRLDATIVRLESDLERERWRVEALETEIRKERAAKDRFANKMVQALAGANGIKNVQFDTDNVKPKTPAIIDPQSEFPFEQMEKIRVAAQAMYESDLEGNMALDSVDEYINLIKQDPTRYILT